MQDADRTLLSVARLTQVIRRAATFGMQNTKTYFSWLALRRCRSSALLRCPGFGILHPAILDPASPSVNCHLILHPTLLANNFNILLKGWNHFSCKLADV
jgi:hypothetical protein